MRKLIANVATVLFVLVILTLAMFFLTAGYWFTTDEALEDIPESEDRNMVCTGASLLLAIGIPVAAWVGYHRG